MNSKDEKYIDKGVYSQGAREKELSSSEGSGGSDLCIFEPRSKSNTTSRRPRAADIPAQPLRSQASRRGLVSQAVALLFKLSD
ncbi:unnamed protein product [Pieris brassicae]|uniref:Uncharacterized protein n=1 Tax=Pieris brassicae TaxID=7116 RepID=A0A9P0TXW0_PIEBR|nr:unnamed protein product [Pieris brassicae]